MSEILQCMQLLVVKHCAVFVYSTVVSIIFPVLERCKEVFSNGLQTSVEQKTKQRNIRHPISTSERLGQL